MRKKEAEDAPNVVTGTFSVKIHPVKVFFNLGATYSFVSTKLVETLRLVQTSKDSLLPIAVSDGK